jgi:hypothetical protein
MAIVRAYARRDDDALSVITAIATQPVVLADGGVIGRESGFDAERGIEFVIPAGVAAAVPRRGELTDDAVADAIDFLTDDWLVDVATTYAGKCVIAAVALTLMERSLLTDRPTFVFEAGRRGSGKGTTIRMIIVAVTGILAAVAAWSTSEEERRKAILAYFRAGVPYILWDNIERGTQLTCPHVERSCTSPTYVDRVLGVSETATVPATTIHLFTGNNIGTSGDLASRNLTVKFTADRPDPENRRYAHPGPEDWTEKNRAKILRALYTILLGNPTLAEPADADMKTRFKMWYRLVGSAVEHAAACAVARRSGAVARAGEPPKPELVDFAAMFLGEEDASDDDASLADLLYAMARKWPGEEKFTAADFIGVVNALASLPSDPHQPLRRVVLEVLFPDYDPWSSPTLDARAATTALRSREGNVVSHAAVEDGKTVVRSLALRAATGYVPGQRHGLKQFWVWAKPAVPRTT